MLYCWFLDKVVGFVILFAYLLREEKSGAVVMFWIEWLRPGSRARMT